MLMIEQLAMKQEIQDDLNKKSSRGEGRKLMRESVNSVKIPT